MPNLLSINNYHYLRGRDVEYKLFAGRFTISLYREAVLSVYSELGVSG